MGINSTDVGVRPIMGTSFLAFSAEAELGVRRAMLRRNA
jgi:hypothetical protein